ncbi:MAG: helix-turn-helix transcriptional regulator [Allomuricauda sp.]
MEPQKIHDRGPYPGLVVHFPKNEQQVAMANSFFGPYHSILLLVKKGRVHFQVNGDGIVLYKGRLVVVPGGNLWSMGGPTSPIHIGILGLSRKFVLGNTIGPLPPSFMWYFGKDVRTIDLAQGDVSFLFLLFSLLGTKRLVAEPSIANGHVLRHGIHMLLWELHRLFQIQGGGLTTVSTAEHLLVLHFMDLLATHYKMEHKVGFYAKHLNVTADHLSRVVKKRTGKTAKEHITETLMEEAKVLLRDNIPIKEIGRVLGFRAIYDFSKFFKRYASLSPRSFRRKVKI